MPRKALRSPRDMRLLRVSQGSRPLSRRRSAAWPTGCAAASARNGYGPRSGAARGGRRSTTHRVGYVLSVKPRGGGPQRRRDA